MPSDKKREGSPSEYSEAKPTDNKSPAQPAPESEQATTSGPTNVPASKEDDGKKGEKRVGLESGSTPAAKKVKTEEAAEDRVNAIPTPVTDAEPVSRGDHMKKMKESGGKKGKGKERARFDPKKSDKHAPYFPAGTKFLSSDNPDVSRAKAQVNQPDPSLLKIRLKDTKGKVHAAAKFVNHANMEWANADMVSKLNKWRAQFLARTIGKKDAAKPARPRWTQAEMLLLKQLIEKKIRKVKGVLGKTEWTSITKKFNKAFKGTTAKKGEKVPDTLNAKKTVVSGGTLKKDHVVTERSVTSIKNQSGKWPEVVAMMKAELEKLVGESSGDEEGGSGEKSGIKKGGKAKEGVKDVPSDVTDAVDSDSDGAEGEDSSSEEDEADFGNGGEIEHGLEDDSDDDIDGQRPAGNTTGGILITA